MNKLERTYDVIKGRILSGTYAPGDRLVLDALARELGVSAVPVREALRRLEAEGWVVYRSNAGARVAPADPRAWEETMQVLAVLDGFATALSAPRLRPGDLARARDLNARAAAALDAGDTVAFTRLNRELHTTLYSRCPNLHLLRSLQETWDRIDALRRSVFGPMPERGRASVSEHADLMDMIAAGAGAARIESAARRHKLATVRAYLRAHGPAASEAAG